MLLPVRMYATILLVVTPMVARAEAGDLKWDLSTDDTRISISVSNNQPSVTYLSGSGVGHNWGSREPASRQIPYPLMDKVWVGQQEFQTEWRFEEGARDTRKGKLVLTFTNTHPRLRLRSIWRAQQGRGPVEHRVEIDNLAGERVTISHQDSLSLSLLCPGTNAELWWIKRGGGNASTQGGTFTEPVTPTTNLALISNCEDGSSPVPWMAVQVAHERGLYVGWEFSGLGHIQARTEGTAESLEVGVGLPADFKTDVEPGETFTVPPAFVGCYAGDVDEGSYSLHRFILEKLRPKVPRKLADPVLAYNLYLDAGGANAKEADVLRSARFCRGLGFEAFMPDAMWFPAAGDWRWDPKRFPGGVRPIEQYVHRHGMKMALWCAWTNGGVSADPNALSVRGPVGHPDWFRGDVGPDWQPGPFYGAQLCLGCREAKQWAIRKTQWLVGHHRLDYLKHDCGPIINSCSRQTHRHHYGVDASYWSAMGYYEVQEKLREAFPNLLLENCSGGGHIKDFGIIQRTHYTVTTDTLSNLPDRQSIYDSTFAFPPVVLQAYTYDNVYPVKGDNPGSFLWRSAMMGAWQIDPTDTAKWTDEERDSTRRAVEAYKRWIRPMLWDAKVHHILPRPDGVHWDGMLYWSPRRKRGTLYIFRPEAKEDRKTVRLKGLDRQKAYWVWSEDGSVPVSRHTGARLMDKGVDLKLPHEYASDLVYLQDASLGKPSGLNMPGAFHLGKARTKSDYFATTVDLGWGPSACARSYRLIVGDSADFRQVLMQTTVCRPHASVQQLPPGRDFYWKVEAVSSGGKRWNDGAAGRFTTPKLSELSGIVFVSDMQWLKATAGADNPVRRDVNYYGKPISIAGKSYPKGVWTHAFNDATPADVVIGVSSGDFSTFVADAGVDDAAIGGSVQFQVLINGEVRAESPVMRQGSVHRFHVEVSGATEITLRVLNGGDGYACDHAAWGFARFVEMGAKDPLKSER